MRRTSALYLMRLAALLCSLSVTINATRTNAYNNSTTDASRFQKRGITTYAISYWTNRKVLPEAVRLAQPAINLLVKSDLKNIKINMYESLKQYFGPSIAYDLVGVTRKRICFLPRGLSRSSQQTSRSTTAWNICNRITFGGLEVWYNETTASVRRLFDNVFDEAEPQVSQAIHDTMQAYFLSKAKKIKEKKEKKAARSTPIEVDQEPPTTETGSSRRLTKRALADHLPPIITEKIQKRVTNQVEKGMTDFWVELDQNIDPALNTIFTTSLEGIAHIIGVQLKMFFGVPVRDSLLSRVESPSVQREENAQIETRQEYYDVEETQSALNNNEQQEDNDDSDDEEFFDAQETQPWYTDPDTPTLFQRLVTKITTPFQRVFTSLRSRAKQAIMAELKVIVKRKIEIKSSGFYVCPDCTDAALPKLEEYDLDDYKTDENEG